MKQQREFSPLFLHRDHGAQVEGHKPQGRQDTYEL